MSDDAKKSKEAQQQVPEKKGGLMKVLMISVIAIALVGLAAFGTVFLMGDSSDASIADGDAKQTVSADSTSADSHKADKTDQGEKSGGTNAEAEHAEVTPEDLPEGLFEGDDPSVMESIMENLALLDYEPTEEELVGEAAQANKEDSVKKVAWFEKEQARLDKREKELKSRSQKLEKLDRDISRKVILIEQAESARVASLAKLYDGMDPRSVAKLMANLDDPTVVSILPRMKSKNASQVLALFPAKRGARLSKQMITIAEK
ncbi:MAG: hypothetical protein P1R58_09980 [bacterium]|nr:hypothetical protein [bacterium]